jgi:DHA1 family multidrug resistance protein-like MFS transporter
VELHISNHYQSSTKTTISTTNRCTVQSITFSTSEKHAMTEMSELQTRGSARSQLYSQRTVEDQTRRRSAVSSISSYSSISDKDHDGHRPSNFEIREAISRSRSRAGDDIATGTGLEQPLSRKLSRRDTALSKIRTRPVVPPFRHPLAKQQTTADVLVDFEGEDDPYRPINWPTKKKITTTLLYGLTTMSATWGSSAYSAGTSQISAEFNVGSQVATLGTTLFLFGFGIGPLIWAPLSEIYGRRLAVLCPMFVAICFSFASAVSKDFQTLMLTRFFGAFFASAPVTNTGGVLGDLYSPAWRGIAMAGYAMAVVGGPCLGKLNILLLTSAFFRDRSVRIVDSDVY